MKRSSVGGAVLLVALLVHAPTAWACSCVRSTPAQQFKAAAVVFTGSVVATDAAPGRATRLTFAVDAVFKGGATENVRVETPRDAASCGVMFTPGRRWTVFAAASGGVAHTTVCMGTTTDQGVLAAAGHPAPVRTYAHTTGLASPPFAPAAKKDNGARAGALGAAALLLALAAVTLILRARAKPVAPPE